MLEHRLRRLEKLARRSPVHQPCTVDEMTDGELAAVINPADPAAVLAMSDVELERVQALVPGRRRRRVSTE